MSRITEDPLSGSLVQRLDKNYKNDSVASVDMDRSVLWQHIVTGCACVCVCSSVPSYTVDYTDTQTHTHTHAHTRAHAQPVTICCHNTDLSMSTDTIEPFL